MQTEVRPPPLEPIDAGTPSRPRRRRWPWLVAAAVVTAILASGIVFVANYDPLCSLHCGGVSGVTGPTVKDLGSFTAPTGEHFGAWQVTHRPGSEFSFWLTLTNNGPLGVTITNVGGSPDEYDRIPVARVQLERPNAHSMSSVEPFHSFSLTPGGDPKDVLVTMRMRGCMEEGTGLDFGTIPVTYRVFGITRHTQVYLATSISVVGPPGGVCPS